MPRVEPLRRPPIGFAHRGARAHAVDNTLEAFELAARLGATGIESDVWVTRDGVAVLDHDGVVGRVRRRSIRQVDRNDLPDHLPTLDDLYDTVGTSVPISLDVKDPNAVDATLRTAVSRGATDRLWLCHPDWRTVAGWRDRSSAVHLVDSTRIGKITEGPERRASSLRAVGVDAINLHHRDWSAGLTTLFHRFGLECLAWDAQQPRVLDSMLAMGIDAIFSDHVDRMVDALARHAAPGVA